MITDNQKLKLMSNWGEKAESLSCFAEVRMYDPMSSWQCYILAVNPNDEDDIYCIISPDKNMEPEVCVWSRYVMSMLYNAVGEEVKQDTEYRPRIASEIYKQLKGAYDSGRN